jgi:L-alanine-DL-glutamate epimerase-like enolase superfamily enzyme
LRTLQPGGRPPAGEAEYPARLEAEPVRAVRGRFGDELVVQADGNGAYTLVDADRLARLDPFGLLLVGVAARRRNLRSHAELARWLRTPVCLDETITSARMAASAPNRCPPADLSASARRRRDLSWPRWS